MTALLREEMVRARKTASGLSDKGAKSALDLYLDKIEERMARRDFVMPTPRS